MDGSGGGPDAGLEALERRFDAAMMDIYERAGREVGYWATRYLQMLRARGGLEAARRLVNARATSAGYARLRDAGRLDLTVEAHVLRPEFEALFTAGELNRARDRLEYFGRLVEAAGAVAAPVDPLSLIAILQARPRPDTTVILPRSRAPVAVRTLLRHERRSVASIPREATCWAPNKIAVDIDGMTTWPELVLVHLLERAGWQARWTKNWAGRREFCAGVGEPRALAGHGEEVFSAIHAHAPNLSGAGTWDVIAWRGSDVLFLESKQAASGDRLREMQLGFLEAALECGLGLASFAVVEYRAIDRGDAVDASRRSASRGSGPGAEPTRATDPELTRLLDEAAQAPGDRRINYRDRIAAFGSGAISAMEAWVESGGSPGFACAVLEATARIADHGAAVRALRRLRARQPSWATVIDPAIARVEAAHRSVPKAAQPPATGRVPARALALDRRVPPSKLDALARPALADPEQRPEPSRLVGSVEVDAREPAAEAEALLAAHRGVQDGDPTPGVPAGLAVPFVDRVWGSGHALMISRVGRRHNARGRAEAHEAFRPRDTPARARCCRGVAR